MLLISCKNTKHYTASPLSILIFPGIRAIIGRYESCNDKPYSLCCTGRLGGDDNKKRQDFV